MSACDRCLARSWLLARLGGHLERVRSRIELVLSLGEQDLISAVAGSQRHCLQEEFAHLDIETERTRLDGSGLESICRCEPSYPNRLRALRSPPAVLHVAGGLDRMTSLLEADPVAVVGARRASGYGIEVARSLARGLGAAGITVVSGMALGVDCAAHAGALEGGGTTVAVLPGSADHCYPASKRPLRDRLLERGAVVSELPPGASVWRWGFPARNRIIAGLAAMTVVVEGRPRSGALLTAAFAQAIDRPVGAVPGRVTTPQAAAPNGLLARGAHVVRGPQDVLDRLFGEGVRSTSEPGEGLDPELALLLDAVASGHDTMAALERAGFTSASSLAGLAQLELGGYLRRSPGGRFEIVP